MKQTNEHSQLLQYDGLFSMDCTEIVRTIWIFSFAWVPIHATYFDMVANHRNIGGLWWSWSCTNNVA